VKRYLICGQGYSEIWDGRAGSLRILAVGMMAADTIFIYLHKHLAIWGFGDFLIFVNVIICAMVAPSNTFEDPNDSGQYRV